MGAVLAGGASRRMGGRPKALVEVDGVPMARRAADALEAAGVPAGSVALVGGQEAWAASLGLVWVPDRWPGEGPLGGLATALLDGPPVAGVAAGDDADALVLVVACDQPWLTGPALSRLVRAVQVEPLARAAVGTADGRRQPFPAAWRASEGERLARRLAAGDRRADAAWEGAAVVEVVLPGAVVADVDRPGDLPPVP